MRASTSGIPFCSDNLTVEVVSALLMFEFSSRSWPEKCVGRIRVGDRPLRPTTQSISLCRNRHCSGVLLHVWLYQYQHVIPVDLSDEVSSLDWRDSIKSSSRGSNDITGSVPLEATYFVL